MKFKISLFNKLLIGTFSFLILIVLITGLTAKPITILELSKAQTSQVASLELTQPCEGINYFQQIEFICDNGRKSSISRCLSIIDAYQQAKQTCNQTPITKPDDSYPSPSTSPVSCRQLCKDAQNRFSCIINCMTNNP